MLGQIDALFVGDTSREEEADAADARQAYIKKHQLDKLVASAVDRAMRHQVASPVEFVAHELLRACQRQQSEGEAA